MVITYQLNEINQIAQQLINQFHQYKVWAFFAPMGAGKTTLTMALAQQWKVVDAVSSPTFSIINEYNTPEGLVLYHMDWYRLKDEQEAIDAGVEDALNSGNICLVEWPERAPELLPSNTLQISINVVNTNTRTMQVQVL